MKPSIPQHDRLPWYKDSQKVLFVTVLTLLGGLIGYIVWLMEGPPPPPQTKSEAGEVHVYTDPDTGCEYLTRFRGSITPRVNAAGQHMGCTK